MKFPICTFDAKVGVLCPKCEERLRSGEISKADVDASFFLSNLVNKNPVLDKLMLKKTYLIDGEYILLFAQGEAQLIFNNKNLMSEIEGLGNKVWISEYVSDERRFIENLIFPIRILTMNLVWLPDGSRQIKAIIAGSFTDSFPIDLEKVRKITNIIKGYDLVFKFERERKRFEKHIFQRY